MRTRTVLAAAAAVAWLAGPSPLDAQEGGRRGGAPPGNGGGGDLARLLAENQRTLLELTEAARRDVAQDELVATLVAHAEAEDAIAAQNTVNRMMAAALETARKAPGLRESSGNYSVGQRQDREDGPLTWVAEQQLNLSSSDGAAVLRVVGDLQGAGLAVQDLRWVLSPAARRGVERQLLGEAIDALQRSARSAADALGLRVVGWRRITVQPEGPPIYQPYRARMATATAEAAAAPPVAASGTSEVVVTVSAEAVLAER